MGDWYHMNLGCKGGFCENGNEQFWSIEDMKYLDHLNNY